MKKGLNRIKIGLVFGLSLMVFVLLGTMLPRTVLGIQASLNVNPGTATIPMGSTQQFEAQFTSDQGTTPANESIPDAFKYALFSGSPTSKITLNGSGYTINGSSHSNNGFTANGSNLKITGTCEAVTTVRVNGSNIQIGEIVESAPSIEMPDFSDQIKTQADAAGQTYNGDKTYNGSNVNVDSPIYVNGNVTINGSHFSGKGTIVATGNITFNGSNLNVSDNDSVCFYSKNGNIRINGSGAILNGMVYAPNGTITMNGSNQTVYGRVVGNIINMNGSGYNIVSSDKDLDSIPKSGQLNWSSSNTSVASVSLTGLATGNGLGTCTITATYTINNVTYQASSQLTIVSLAVTPSTTAISLGSSQQYQASLYSSIGNSTDVTQSVTWSSSNTGVATINSSGLVTGNGAGTCTITATYLINGVSIPTTASLTVVNFSISPSTKIISLGSTQQYNAIITDALGNVTDVTPSVTWSSISLGLQLSTISPSGLVTSKGLGTCLIQATYIINGVSITTSASLTIIKPVLSITPTTAMIMLGSTQPFQATLTDYDGNRTYVTAAVTWSSDNPNVATIDQATGIATGVGVGTSTITGTYIINGESITATTLLKIVNLSITPTSSTVWTGYETSFRAILTDYTGNSNDVTSSVSWSSNSLPGLASVIFKQPESVTEPVWVTAYGVGTCTITAMDSFSNYGTATLTIIMPDLSITPLSKNIMPGSHQQYQAVLTDSEGNTRDITSSANWISNNLSVATVDKGLATGGNVAGTCTITANDTKSGASNTATLTVMAPTELRLTLANTAPLAINGNVQITAVLVYPDGSTKDVTDSVSISWTSSNPNVATVETAKAYGHGGGQCIITASDSNSGLSGTVNITVLPSLTISPSSTTIPIDFPLHYSAQLVYADGTAPLDVTGRVTWSSSNPSVADINNSDINNSGIATGRAAGTTTITANDPVSGSYNTSNLTVTATMPITALIVKPVPYVEVIFTGYTQQFSAQLQFSDESTSDVTNSVIWTSSAVPVATINNTGLVTGVTIGTSLISATVDINGQPLTGSYSLNVLSTKGGIIRAKEQ